MISNAKEKIMAAGKKEFAKNGFNNTSIRTICKVANVNIALVKYYFRDKEGLYRELIHIFFAQKEAQMANQKTLESEKIPEIRLRLFLSNILNSIDPDGEDIWMQSIMKYELIEQGILTEELFSKIILRDIVFLKSIYAEITGLNSNNLKIQQLAELTMANCIFYTINNHLFLKLHNGKHPEKKYFKILLETVLETCLAGAKSISKKK